MLDVADGTQLDKITVIEGSLKDYQQVFTGFKRSCFMLQGEARGKTGELLTNPSPRFVMSCPRHLPQVHGVGLTVTFSLRSNEARSPYSASYCRSAVQHAQTRMYEFQSAVSSQHLFLLGPKASASQSQEEYSPDIRLPNEPSENTFPFTRLAQKTTMKATQYSKTQFAVAECGCRLLPRHMTSRHSTRISAQQA